MEEKEIGPVNNFPLPAYLDPDAWAGFVEMRARELKKPLSTRAAKLILYELQRIKDAGHSPNAALDQSTLHNWADVYQPKVKPIEKVGAALEAEQAEAIARTSAHEARMIRESIERAGLSPAPTVRRVA